MIGVLGISHKDTTQASMWFRHTSNLPEEQDGHNRLLVFWSPRVSERMRKHIARSIPSFTISFHEAPVHERGYPGSASHLFVLAMEEAGRLYPGEPLLWLESDAIPMKPGWFDAIAEEYATCDKPFMGHLEAAHAIPHLAGVAVYPHNWKELSPMLANSHTAPDIPFFGRGKGQAFDAYAAPEVFPQSRQAKTIQQVFGKRRWYPQDLNKIGPETVLIHQSKDGSLINLLSKR